MDIIEIFEVEYFANAIMGLCWLAWFLIKVVFYYPFVGAYYLYRWIYPHDSENSTLSG